jgi:hypothetical protein
VAFIRSKKVGQRNYNYLVESCRDPKTGKVRQRDVVYLGKAETLNQALWYEIVKLATAQAVYHRFVAAYGNPETLEGQEDYFGSVAFKQAAWNITRLQGYVAKLLNCGATEPVCPPGRHRDDMRVQEFWHDERDFCIAAVDAE